MKKNASRKGDYSTTPQLLRALRAGASATAVVCALLAGGSANALNGIGGTEASNYETGECQSLRTTPGRVDAVLACSDASCNRLAALAQGGGALGFCEDGLFGGVPPSIIGSDLHEDNTHIRASSFGGAFSLSLPNPTRSVGTWCQSYPPVATTGGKGGGSKKAELPPPGRKFCVTFDRSVVPPASDTSHVLPVVQNPMVCEEVAAGVEATVRRTFDPLFVALISVAVSEEDQPTELVACDGVGWQRKGPRGASATLDIEDFWAGDTPWLYGNTGTKK